MNEQEAQRSPRGEQDSLAPVELDRLTVDEEVAMMQRGKSGRLVVAALALVLAGGGAFTWMQRMDTRDAYTNAATVAVRLHHEHLDAFLRCALPRADAAQLQSQEGLSAAFANHGALLGRAHSGVLARCAEALVELSREVAAIRAPNPLRPQLTALHQAAEALRRAADGYRAQLGAADGYDAAQLTPAIEKIVLARATYQQRQAALERAVRSATD